MNSNLTNRAGLLVAGLLLTLFDAGTLRAQVNSTNIVGTNNVLSNTASSAAIIAGNTSTNGGTNSAIIGAANSIVPTGTRFAFIGAGNFNNIAAGSHSATVIGGFSNAVSAGGVRGVVVGGAFNANAGRSSSILGGEYNRIEPLNPAAGPGAQGATIGGGISNLVRSNGYAATIGGGMENWAVDYYTTIGGGYSNSVGGFNATIGGGRENTANNYNATVAGGLLNTAFGNNSAIAGGSGNSAAGTNSSVGGGNQNEANGRQSTIAGGRENVIGPSGDSAAVGGGFNNQASQAYSTVPGGTRARATNYGSFVWSGDAGEDTDSFGNMTFTVRAEGGVRFYTANGTNTGVALGPGGTTWGSPSDSNLKTKVTAIEPREILSKLAAMPVTKWEYKTVPNRRYIGPMAQDFHAAFGLGDDKTITTLDSDGVMYAAIQGLVEELRERDKAIKELKAKSAEVDVLKAQNEALSRKIEAIDQRLNSLPPSP